MQIITLKNISKSFDNSPILKDISLELKKGEITTLLGSSGSGKTTILRTISGLTTPELGEVYIDNKLASCDRKIILKPHERKIGYIFQDLALWPHMSIYENIAFGLKVQKADDIKTRVLTMLEFFSIEKLQNRYPNQLSGGQQQLVAIARSLVLNPKILLLDEPLSNLDVKLKTKMQDEILKLKEKFSISMVYVTHDHKEAFSLADKIVILNHGEIEEVGTPKDIKNSKNKFIKEFIEL